MIAGFLQGIGTGLMFAPLTVLAFATLAPAHRTEGTVVATMVRSLGSSLGIAVLQAALIRRAPPAHERLAAPASSRQRPVIRWVLPQVARRRPGGGSRR